MPPIPHAFTIDTEDRAGLMCMCLGWYVAAGTQLLASWPLLA